MYSGIFGPRGPATAYTLSSYNSYPRLSNSPILLSHTVHPTFPSFPGTGAPQTSANFDVNPTSYANPASPHFLSKALSQQKNGLYPNYNSPTSPWSSTVQPLVQSNYHGIYPGDYANTSSFSLDLETILIAILILTALDIAIVRPIKHSSYEKPYSAPN